MERSLEAAPAPRGRSWRWLRRGFLGLLLVVVAAAVTGFAYQTVAESIDRRAHPAPGELIDVGSRRMHLLCMGAGAPVVILEAGLGEFTLDWTWVQGIVSDTTRVCAYDRAGMGWSDAGPKPRDAEAIAGDLHALLAAAELPGPYVLAGHSFGGLYVRAYAAEFPEEVAGVALIDSSHPDQWTRPPRDGLFAVVQWTYRAARAAVRVGVLRAFDVFPVDPDLPPDQATTRKAMSDMVGFVDAAADEFDASAATTAILHAAGTLGDRPLYVLTAGARPDESPALVEQWFSLQDELATLSTNRIHDVVEDATHMSLLTKAADAARTGTAILAVVEAVRTGAPLNDQN